MTRSRLALTVTAGAAGLALLTTACGGGSSTSSGTAKAQDPSVLTVASAIAPNSLNPALGGSADPQQYFFELAYDTLIRQAPNGTYTPALATKWGFVGSDSKTFDLTLRSGVKFNDGSALTADGVKKSLQYYAKAGGPLAADLAPVGSIDAVSPLQLRIHLKTSDPLLPLYLSRPTTGEIISPVGLARTSELGTTTHGAGPYVIDTAQTVSGQTYTYVPNPTYYDKSRVHWKKVVVKVIKDENTTLSAFRSGEVDYALGDSTTAKAAKSAGFQVLSSPYSIMQLMIQDRAGTMVKALGDLRVRQAMMYGINRDSIAKALYGSYAKGWDYPVLANTSGYTRGSEGKYPYDVAKAKKLLAAAGYPGGFTMSITVNLTGVGESQAAEAFAAEMANIGINVKINVPANVNELFSTYAKFPAMMFDYGTGIAPPYAQGNDLLHSWGNPLKVSDKQLDTLYSQAASSSTAQLQEQGWQKFEQRLSDLSWTIPMVSLEKIVYVRPGLKGVDLSATNLTPDLTTLYAAK
ncbi:ABC transporter substrate-binding protein [Streptomyces prunicolor]|uniref:ABC transporter substrate-binding protein n=1 Tax=Streptomyces prunicolor TaxID=67348 RepID=UPI002257A4CA|nr:ABC transporter substrate-binding protein [Streptomyces prunicolor]MCX5241349.1 ABC transporter substrate-binding protein [Streptomyces prunicolor]